MLMGVVLVHLGSGQVGVVVDVYLGGGGDVAVVHSEVENEAVDFLLVHLEPWDRRIGLSCTPWGLSCGCGHWVCLGTSPFNLGLTLIIKS